MTCKVHAQSAPSTQNPAQKPPPAPTAPRCLPAGNGYLKARLSGAIEAELNWGNDDVECTGAVRPTDGGIRMRFRHQSDDGNKDKPTGPAAPRLVIVFGIANLPEGQPASTVPVNVTVIREGAGEFYSTQGDDKCMLDKVEQQPIVGIPNRSRSYRIVARGFCTEPARAVRGKGAVMLSRFDYAGRVDFGEEAQPDVPLVAAQQLNKP